MKQLASILCLAVTLGALGGCAATDPLQREGLWRPLGVNDQNIAAQVANPADLVRGQETEAGGSGQIAAAAVTRLRLDRVKALSDSAITDLRVQSAPGGSSAAGGGAGS